MSTKSAIYAFGNLRTHLFEFLVFDFSSKICFDRVHWLCKPVTIFSNHGSIQIKLDEMKI